MKKGLVWLVTVGVFLGFSGVAYSNLTVIGTANYLGSEYSLIYEDNSIYGGLVWLDYTSGQDTWQNQVSWASGLGTGLSVTLNPGYATTINWETGWRLPTVDESKANLTGPWNPPTTSRGRGYQGADETGYYDYDHGYNMTNSELGHLYYVSLENRGYKGTDGTEPQPGFGLANTGPFSNLQASYYWTGTEYSLDTGEAWLFEHSGGSLSLTTKDWGQVYAIAVHPFSNSTAPVPEPATMLLFGVGLSGLAALRKKLARE